MSGGDWQGGQSVLELSSRTDVIRSSWRLPPRDGACARDDDGDALYVTTTDNNLLRLTGASAQVLQQVDGHRTVAEIAASTVPPGAEGGEEAVWSEEVSAFLTSLLGLGLLRARRRTRDTVDA